MRTIPLDDSALYLLEQRRKHQVSEYIFNIDNGRRSAWYTSNKFKKYIVLLHLNGKLHFHSLRHTFATWLIEDGVNIYEVQKLLGHSSVKVTEVYSHLVSSELRSAVNKTSLRLN